MDCAGLIIRVAWDLGISDYDTTGYSRMSLSHEFREKFAANMDKVAYTRAQPGDVLLIRDDIFPQHCGIVSERGGRPTLIHSFATKRRVVEDFMTDDILAKRVAAFAFRGIV
jgi:cell wall-associated NlpC family hydrolase